MRVSVVAVAAAGLMLTGCGTVPSLPWARSQAMPTRASCPAMTNAQWSPVVEAAVHKTFDGELRKRFGDAAVHSRIGWSKTDKGDTVVTVHRIGPAHYAMPEPGKGGAVEVVFRACTGKPLKTRKVGNLEKKPRPLAAESAN